MCLDGQNYDCKATEKTNPNHACRIYFRIPAKFGIHIRHFYYFCTKF